MKVEILGRSKNGIEIWISLEPHRIQDFYRWLRNNNVAPPREWNGCTTYAKYGQLVSAHLTAPEKIANQLEGWAEKEKHKHE